MVTKEQLFTGEEKYDRISLLQFRIIEFYFEKSFLRLTNILKSMIPWRSAGSAGIMTQNLKELMKCFRFIQIKDFIREIDGICETVYR